MNNEFFAIPGRDQLTAALRWPSTRTLIAANLAVLAGVFAGWSVSFLVILYWSESAVIGAYTILKMFVAARGIERVMCIGLSLLFIVHFGAFMFGHALFVILLVAFIEGPFPGGPTITQLHNVLAPIVTDPWLLFALLVMVVSHGVSFVTNSLRCGELAQRRPEDMLMDPYRRVVVMHMAIFASATLIGITGAPETFAAALVFLKTGSDIAAHVREHQREPA